MHRSPLPAQVGVDFAGTSGSFASHLDATFNVAGFVHDIPFYGPWNFCFHCGNYSPDPSRSFTPAWRAWGPTAAWPRPSSPST